jgi:hypothetical protein
MLSRRRHEGRFSGLELPQRVSELHPNFTWESAEHPEAELVDAKVLHLFEGKDLFIGICTARECVVEADAVTHPWYSQKKLVGNSKDFGSKASDWIIPLLGITWV